MNKTNETAIITGANGGIGFEITRAVAQAGYKVIMACRNTGDATTKRDILIQETGNKQIEVRYVDQASLSSVKLFADELLKEKPTIKLLMNNAGTISRTFGTTGEGFEQTVCINYIAHFLLVRKLLPLMKEGSRIVNMVSCTYPLGKIDLPDFFTQGRKGKFRRLSVYSNTKLALLLFTFELAERLKEKGITVNAADPGIVSTNMITMHQWFDPLADLFFRPFIRTPRKGASTAIELLLEEKHLYTSGQVCAGKQIRPLSPRFTAHPSQKELW
ncbi:MAG: SDR family oxidoreductase, partial [Tannerellaceae bacterium]|nr:SDR family oxidoreductase [Tannerellaceae bacterium]